MQADTDTPQEMEDNATPQPTAPESQSGDASATTPEGVPPEGGDSAAPEAEGPSQPEEEAAKWREISLRTAAEMENLRKRTSREREEAVRYANARLLEELLPVIDNFEMGMQAAAEDRQSMIYIGMDMVRKQLNEFLASQGLEEVATDGLFDPNLHDAVAQEACDKGEEGRILRVTRRGFKLRDRLLRPASVVVSKIPTDQAAAQEDVQTPDNPEES